MKEFKKRDSEYWDCNDEYGCLCYDNEAEAIINYLEQEAYDSPVPDEIDIYGFSKKQIDEKFIESYYKQNCDSALETILDDLDYNLACEDHNTEITEDMRIAYRNFINTILKLYEVTGFEMVEYKRVKTRDYLTQEKIDELNESLK